MNDEGTKPFKINGHDLRWWFYTTLVWVVIGGCIAGIDFIVANFLPGIKDNYPALASLIAGVASTIDLLRRYLIDTRDKYTPSR